VIRKPNRISENRNREGEVSQEKSPSRFFVFVVREFWAVAEPVHVTPGALVRIRLRSPPIGHDHKFMQQKPPLSTILRKNIQQKLSHAIGWKKGAASGCRRGHEKRTS
jgi:hypothetical protein